jgi:hypothetical protein
MSAGDVHLESKIADADVLIQVNDGGVTKTAIAIDASDDAKINLACATAATSPTAAAIVSAGGVGAQSLAVASCNSTAILRGTVTTGVVVPVTPGAALTAQLTSITHTAPGTPDYAIQDLTNSSGYGFVTKDEGNTVLSVILNLQTRVAELEARFKVTGGNGLIADAA